MAKQTDVGIDTGSAHMLPIRDRLFDAALRYAQCAAAANSPGCGKCIYGLAAAALEFGVATLDELEAHYSTQADDRELGGES
jgi:hypothetical protein